MTEDTFPGHSEMAGRMRLLDWSTTPLGPVEHWPQSLRTSVSTCLDCAFPIVLWWGPELAVLYNDEYAQIMGPSKHPAALGQPGMEVWSEIWDVIEPMLAQVMTRGEATRSRDLLLLIDRGYLQETYFSFSYSPIHGEEGKVSGVFCPVIETTDKVIGERRLRTLRDLAACCQNVANEQAVYDAAAAVLSENPYDIPFALIYRIEDQSSHERCATLAAVSGAERGAAVAPEVVRLRQELDPWSLSAVASFGERTVVPVDPAADVPTGVWKTAPYQAIVLPVLLPGQTQPRAIVVAAVNPMRELDADYQTFFELLARQVASALADAKALDEERARVEALAEIDRAKTAFFSNVSHEFRTPLTLMIGPLEELLAMDRERLSNDASTAVEIAHRNGLRLLKLVNTLLDFARIEAGRADAHYQPTDLAQLTSELASVFRSAIEKAGLELVVDCEPLPAPVFVDREMWEKIVLNLLSNAFKFTFAGKIRLALRWDGEFVTLDVADTGVGIAAAEVPLIFERFRRVKNAQARTHEGTGIGLALVQELARLHGGSVSVTSTEGRGSTFSVRVRTGTAHLPQDHIAEPQRQHGSGVVAAPFLNEAQRWQPATGAKRERRPAAANPDSAAATSVARVLIADDNADMRDYLMRILGQHYDVEAVADGRVALDLIRTTPPDLVLTDVMMPGLDGFGLLNEIRGSELTAAIPLIMLSARAGEEARIEGLRAGADDYLAKPFSARELLASVDSQLRLAQLRKDVEQATRRRTAEEREAAATRAYLAAIVDSADDAILSKDLNGIIQSCNAAGERMFGYSAAELIGRPVRMLIPPERQSEEDEILSRLSRGESIDHFETVRVTKDGRHLDISLTISPMRDETGTIIGASKIVRDITAIRAAEAERVRLLQENAEVTDTLNTVGAIVASDLDRDKVVQAVTDAGTALTTAEFGAFFYNVLNDAGESYTLYTISGVPREEFSKFPMPRNTEVFEPTFKGTGVVRSDDITQDPRYGQNPPHYGMPAGHLPVRSYLAVPVRGRFGDVIGGLFFGHSDVGRFTDHHERLAVGIASWASVALENARLYMNVQEASRIKDEFLASLSHELRTPLNAILGYARLFRAGIVTPEKHDKAIETIERNATSLTQIVEDVLDISRIVAGKIRLDVQPVEFPDLVRRAIDVVMPAAEAKGVRLETVLDPRASPVSGDPERLQQVLWNLLSNGVKFTNRGGKVHVRLECVNSHIEVTVSDTGVGIPQAFLPHVFERFRQADAGTTRERGGLGLGLAIARQLTEMHGGTLEASSAGVGQGASFRLRLPLMSVQPFRETELRVHPRTAVSSAERVLGDLRGIHVLVVDDERDALALVAAVLEAAGARVTTASSVEEALTAIDAEVPDVIVADLGMPHVDGYQFVERLRNHANPLVRVVPAAALTAYARSDDRVKVLRAGFDLHLAKPIDPAELVTTIAALSQRFTVRSRVGRAESSHDEPLRAGDPTLEDDEFA